MIQPPEGSERLEAGSDVVQDRRRIIKSALLAVPAIVTLNARRTYAHGGGGGRGASFKPSAQNSVPTTMTTVSTMTSEPDDDEDDDD